MGIAGKRTELNYLKRREMQAKIFNTIKLSTVFGLLGASFLFIQCKKDPTEASVTFTDLATGKKIEGASVTFTIGDSASGQGFFLCDEGFVESKTYTTNSSGVINECFELPALITVTATYGVTVDTTGMDSATAAAALAAASLNGEGKLNLIEHEKTTLEIKMN